MFISARQSAKEQIKLFTQQNGKSTWKNAHTAHHLYAYMYKQRRSNNPKTGKSEKRKSEKVIRQLIRKVRLTVDSHRANKIIF